MRDRREAAGSEDALATGFPGGGRVFFNRKVDGSVMLETLDLCKSFGPVPVLKRVSLQLRAGCILGLIGENGAGKSTFINCLSGALVPDSGRILLDGRPRRFPDRASALAAGIVTVPQEFNLIGPLRVWENIFLGAEPRHFGLLDRAAMKRRSRELLARLHCDLDVDRRVEDLSVAEKQFVEIARALNRDCRVLILDALKKSSCISEVCNVIRVEK